MANIAGIDPEMTVDEVVKKYPKAQPVLVRYGVDTCCGGFRKIKDGARIAGVDLRRLLDELAQATN